ncbi:Bcr/CflA family drug resistance efflux transporter [Luteitalea sp. TBR-22]|uniref:multidrug effflux MFS transporter n=1 Tax=Luteitalea sp. TBR-22 TaxID=2802971 RepID=UPI001AF66127|nr:multidrug effflux MFS transporter [Luteitalea sp. TBR-22]BCS32319.1 Bcr/CflA family drug resistance efflux transporter [Luteitalea sp. TBR-22]
MPRGLILLLGSLTAIAPMSIDMYLPAFPTLEQALATDAAAVQRTLSVFFLGLSLGQLGYGPMSDRFGRRLPLLVGLALYTLASLGCALATSIGMLTAWRGLQALGGCAGVVMARAVVRDVFGPREAARVLSSLMLVMGVAPILAPLVGGWVLAHAGWRALFGILMVFGASCWVAVWRGLPDTAPDARATTLTVGTALAAFGRVARHPRFRRFASAQALAQCVLFAYIAGAPFLYMQVLGLSPSGFAAMFGLNSIGLIGASQLNRALLRREETGVILWRALLVQLAAGAVFLGLVLSGSTGLVALAAPILVLVLLLGFVLPNTTALALAPFDRDAGTASALLGAAQYGTSGLATLAVSAAFDGTLRPMAVAIVMFLVFAIALSRDARMQR